MNLSFEKIIKVMDLIRQIIDVLEKEDKNVKS